MIVCLFNDISCWIKGKVGFMILRENIGNKKVVGM